MSLYDDYFTNDDKPFAENFNDALLLSNVFDLTVPIELPRMFNNGEWSTGTGQRKAGVSIIQTEGIDGSDVVIDTYEDEQGNTVCGLMANATATVLITVYPNFNQYGNLQKVYWEFEDGSDENLTVDVLTEQRTALLTNIPNNSVLSSVPYLQQLNRFILRLNFEGGTGIKKLGFIMQNKQQDRYGAEVGISDVNGLTDALNGLSSDMSDGFDSVGSELETIMNDLDTVSNKVVDITYADSSNMQFISNTPQTHTVGYAVVKNNFCQLYLQTLVSPTEIMQTNNTYTIIRLGNWDIAPKQVGVSKVMYTSRGKRFLLEIVPTISNINGRVDITPIEEISEGDYLYISETYLV